jgi:cyclopropane-fatty-acyl-phospholipid synthase
VPVRTRALRREIATLVPERPVHVALWDGTRLDAPDPAAPTLHLRSPRAIGHLLRAPGQLGITRAYVSGEVEAEDLDRTLPLVDAFSLPPLGRRKRARLTLAALRAMGPSGLPRKPAVEARLHGRRHGRRRDALAVRYHYDVPAEFFALFLDSSMTYSCALWSRGARTLDEAQEQKLDLLCRKLELRPGARVLDVGCGWGSFAVHAATRYGAQVLGITLSEAQASWARARVERLALADRVEIHVGDYRDLGPQRFDAAVSIGMAEHVGEERLDEYALGLAGAVRPGGYVINHAIAPLAPGGGRIGPFSERYVFPDGELVHLSRTLLAFERSGFETLHTESLRGDYLETVRHWCARLDERLPEAERIAGSERTRAWRLYLRGSIGGFARGSTGVYQTLLRRDPGRAPWRGPAGWERRPESPVLPSNGCRVPAQGHRPAGRR